MFRTQNLDRDRPMDQKSYYYYYHRLVESLLSDVVFARDVFARDVFALSRRDDGFT